ncbi:MAG: hypothetical protein Unbinned5406contig1000_17 [Prokaryotic dsDNA virus sp.]|nr:MAG: hypothetical protein Unbinned5406contig1000_17 [Prokaryotic dsDNA virus sp.]|tara:strand:- start:40839 stop:41519 length:681 start_codon:yes stop_codon:yes gene_type:complete
MATVRFSDSLKHEIQNNAKVMFHGKIQQAKNNVPAHWADKVYECLFPQVVRDQMKALPDYVLRKSEHIDISGWSNAPSDVWQTSSYTHDTWQLQGSVRLSFSTPMPWVDSFDSAPTGFSKSYSKNEFDYNDSRWDWLKPEFKEYNRKVFEATNKQESFLSSVNKLMETYTTLAPALKAWRPLWDLLPDEAKDRHKTVKERKVVKAEELDLDLNAMTSAVTLSKITR